MKKFLNEIEKATKKLEELGYDKNQIVNILVAYLNNVPMGIY